MWRFARLRAICTGVFRRYVRTYGSPVGHFGSSWVSAGLFLSHSVLALTLLESIMAASQSLSPKKPWNPAPMATGPSSPGSDGSYHYVEDAVRCVAQTWPVCNFCHQAMADDTSLQDVLGNPLCSTCYGSDGTCEGSRYHCVVCGHEDSAFSFGQTKAGYAICVHCHRLVSSAPIEPESMASLEKATDWPP